MPLSAVVVDVGPDPIAIAQFFEGRPGFSFLHTAQGTGWGQSFVAVDPVETSDVVVPLSRHDASTPFDGVSANRLDTRMRAPRWIGAVPYECARKLERPAWVPEETRAAPHVVAPRWSRYGAVVEVEPAANLVRVIGDEPHRVATLARELAAARPSRRAARGLSLLEPLVDDDPPAAHLRRVRCAQVLIAEGDLYQVNLARRLRFRAHGSPLELYLALALRAPAPFGACLDLGDTFACATSPELFLAVGRGLVRTAPIKGTRPRGVDAPDDARLARELAESIKEQAELTMIVDVERNDMGRVARTGSVRVLTHPRVETHRTIHHRAAILEAALRPEVGLAETMDAMFPSGSVTGAPKVRAMEVIAQLEPARRGLYTGAFGTVRCDGSLTLAMAIRVLTVQQGVAHYFAGGGIVADSDPETELLETRWKATQTG